MTVATGVFGTLSFKKEKIIARRRKPHGPQWNDPLIFSQLVLSGNILQTAVFVHNAFFTKATNPALAFSQLALNVFNTGFAAYNAYTTYRAAHQENELLGRDQQASEPATTIMRSHARSFLSLGHGNMLYLSPVCMFLGLVSYTAADFCYKRDNTPPKP